jgi:hypothetical protein
MLALPPKLRLIDHPLPLLDLCLYLDLYIDLYLYTI